MKNSNVKGLLGLLVLLLASAITGIAASFKASKEGK